VQVKAQVKDEELRKRFGEPGKKRRTFLQRSNLVITRYASEKANQQDPLPNTSRRFSSLLQFSGHLIGLFSQTQWPELHQMRDVALAVQ